MYMCSFQQVYDAYQLISIMMFQYNETINNTNLLCFARMFVSTCVAVAMCSWWRFTTRGQEVTPYCGESTECYLGQIGSASPYAGKARIKAFLSDFTKTKSSFCRLNFSSYFP